MKAEALREVVELIREDADTERTSEQYVEGYWDGVSQAIGVINAAIDRRP